MRRALVVALIVVAVLGLMTTPVAADVSIVDGPDDVEMDSDSDSTELEIENDGEEEEDVTVDIQNTPSGIDVSHQTTVTIGAGETATVELDIEADETVDNEDVEGNVDDEPFSFTVDRPPLAGFEDEPLDLGDVLVGETEDGDVTVEEFTGDGTLDGVSWEIVNDDSDADLSFSENDMSTISGSEGTAGWEIDVDDDADQHEELSWTVELAEEGRETDQHATREVDVEARVIYPGYFGDLEVEDEIVFDAPRDENDELTRTLQLDVENAGDLPLDISSISADASNVDISAEVPDEPDEIDSTSTETVDISVTADTSLSEDEYDIDVDASADDFDVDDASYSGEFEIVHGTELSADSVNFGDVPIGESQTATTEVSEELGYNDLTDLSVDQSSGSDDWISADSTPSSLDASGSETVEFGLEFDTGAEIGNEYEWTYTIDGERDTEQVTITATPIPLDLDPIRDDLSDYDGDVADNTVDLVNTMDDQIRDGDPSDDDVSSVLAFGDAATLYLSSVNEADDYLADDDHDAAQQEISRAATALNTMSLYSEQLSDPQQQTASQDVVSDGEATVESLVDQQAVHYEEQLDSGELTLLEEATINRQLSQIATLQGDTERGEELEAESSEAFDSYVDTVSGAEEEVQNAESAWSEMESEQFVTVLGQPLMFNPAEYDTFSERSNEMETSYEEAIDSFEEAGATSRAETVATERDSRSLGTTIATGSLVISTGLFGLVSIGLIGRTARQMYWYAQDSRETVSGDFLL